MDDSDGTGERKGQRWTEEEDAMLKMYLEEFGGQRRKWTLISEKIPGRSETGCRVRWAQLCGKRNQPSKKSRSSDVGAAAAMHEGVASMGAGGMPTAGKRMPTSTRKRKRDVASNGTDDSHVDASDEHEEPKKVYPAKKAARRGSAPAAPTRGRGRSERTAKRPKLEELATVASATISGDEDDAASPPPQQPPPAGSKGRKGRAAQQQAQQYAQQQMAQQVASTRQSQQQSWMPSPAYPVTVIASLEDRKQIIPGSWQTAEQIREALLTSFDLRGAPASGPGSVIAEYESKGPYAGEWLPLTSQTPVASMGGSVKVRIRFETPLQPTLVAPPEPSPHTHMPALNQSGGISPAALHQPQTPDVSPYATTPSTGINMAAVHSPYTL